MALLFFYGIECPHCEKMLPLVDRLEREERVNVEKLESWHNDENQRKLEEIPEQAECGGVPFLYNTDSKKWICGEDTYENLKKWAGK